MTLKNGMRSYDDIYQLSLYLNWFWLYFNLLDERSIRRLSLEHLLHILFLFLVHILNIILFNLSILHISLPTSPTLSID